MNFAFDVVSLSRNFITGIYIVKYAQSERKTATQIAKGAVSAKPIIYYYSETILAGAGAGAGGSGVRGVAVDG